MTRVAVVTGSNKGIGFAIVRGLCKKFEGDVYLTARNEELGKKAVADLEKEGLSPKFHQLDISNINSITCLRDFLKTKYEGLDVLVNNAGVAFKQDATESFGEQAEVSLGVNFTGTLNVCDQLFPLLRPHARVCNVSSFVSQWALKKCSKALQDKLTDPQLQMVELKNLMQQFVDSAKGGDHKAKGWPDMAYGTSKIGVTALTIVQQREINEKDVEDIVINAADPGYVDTDMSSHKGKLTIDQGAETPIYLSLLPAKVTSPKGKLVSEKKVGEWKTST